MPDWIAWQKGLCTKPEIIQVARQIGVSRFEAAAMCMVVWEWADTQTSDGFVCGVTAGMVSELVGVEGIGEAMAATRPKAWLLEDSDGVMFPEYSRWNSSSAKARLKKNQKQAAWRAGKERGAA